jgi:hypothetical protein
MSDHAVIPEDFAAWRHCITIRCQQPLTREFIAMRLAALRDMSSPATREFTEKYGPDYTNRVIGWFEQAEREATR